MQEKVNNAKEAGSHLQGHLQDAETLDLVSKAVRSELIMNISTMQDSSCNSSVSENAKPAATENSAWHLSFKIPERDFFLQQ